MYNENNNIGNQVPNNNGNMNPTNPVTSQFQTGENQEINNANSIANNNQINNQPNDFNNMGNTAPNQFMNQQPVHPNYNNQQFVQPQMNQAPQQSQSINQVSQQQMINPNYQNYNSNNFGQPINNGNKKNNKKLFIIIGGIILALIVVIVLVMILTKGQNSKTVNEYEESNVTNNNNANNNGSNSGVGEKITYQGFEFEKLSGYKYLIENGELSIYDTKYAMIPMVYDQDFSLIKTAYLSGEDGMDELKSEGYSIGKNELKTISGVEIIYYEFSYVGNNVYMCYIPTTEKGYSLFVSAFAKSNSFDSKILNEVVKLKNTMKYVGNYSNYSKKTNFDFKSKLFEK